MPVAWHLLCETFTEIDEIKKGKIPKFRTVRPHEQSPNRWAAFVINDCGVFVVIK